MPFGHHLAKWRIKKLKNFCILNYGKKGNLRYFIQVLLFINEIKKSNDNILA